MIPSDKISRMPSSIDLRELDNFRNLTSHREIACVRAMHYCATHQLCPPEWLVHDAASLMIELIKKEKVSRRGRTASHLARLQQELKNNERWSAVKDIHRIRSSAKQDNAILRSRPTLALDKNRKKHYEKRKKWLKQDTFQAASKILAGRDANAGAAAIKKSYGKIEKDRKNHPELMVGAWFDDEFLKALGLQASYDRKLGTKLGDIFDLT